MAVLTVALALRLALGGFVAFGAGAGAGVGSETASALVLEVLRGFDVLTVGVGWALLTGSGVSGVSVDPV